MSVITKEQKPEFIGQIIDIFEDFLEEKGIRIDNEDKQMAIEDGEDPKTLAIIYGEDYGTLQTQLEEMMSNWKVTDNQGSDKVWTKETIIESLQQALHECTDDCEYAGVLTAGVAILGMKREDLDNHLYDC